MALPSPIEEAVSEDTLVDLIRKKSTPFDEIEDAPLGALLDRIGDARVVLLGEATHGTSEFYEMRARITRELVEKKGFDFVAVEADWPDAAYYDRWARSIEQEVSEDPFRRFPQWMWRNGETYDLIRWLRSHNEDIENPDQRVGFHGLDVYSLYRSVDAVLEYLEKVDGELLENARQRYSCFEGYEEEPQNYGLASLTGRGDSCEAGTIEMLQDLLDSRLNSTTGDSRRFLNALQNARVVANAEKYYRSMYRGSVSSWNLRDSHMFDTLKVLLDSYGEDSKAVVWEHNSHVGDASATQMGQRGEHNVGMLSRNKWGDDAYIIGFGTHTGQVAAASDWGGPMEIKDIRPSREDSYENLFHRSPHARSLTPLRPDSSAELYEGLQSPRLERAIGVIYRPETERQSHYFHASLSSQFDEYVWFDETSPVDARVDKSEEQDDLYELFPSGL